MPKKPKKPVESARYRLSLIVGASGFDEDSLNLEGPIHDLVERYYAEVTAKKNEVTRANANWQLYQDALSAANEASEAATATLILADADATHLRGELTAETSRANKACATLKTLRELAYIGLKDAYGDEVPTPPPETVDAPVEADLPSTPPPPYADDGLAEVIVTPPPGEEDFEGSATGPGPWRKRRSPSETLNFDGSATPEDDDETPPPF